jgi:integrase
LGIKDIVFDPGLAYIKVRGKGRRERIVTIAPVTAGHIREYIRVFHGDAGDRNAILFSTRIKGAVGKMSVGNVERFIKKYADKAREECKGIPESVYPHMFRRTRASRLYQEGTELELISKILGHAMTQTTRIYVKPSMQQMRTAMAAGETPEQVAEKPLWEACSEEEKAKLCSLR